MMHCPTCKSATEVIGSRASKGGVYRRRKCLNPDCARFNTREMPESHFERSPIEIEELCKSKQELIDTTTLLKAEREKLLEQIQALRGVIQILKK